ncbi:9085_t:CDS:2 [Paraglomus brasilianum]|uniref:9085_t:CDS:1 n=1 Tax=Paraglomus brasilianum TaxID=144538 RepID=A0A9N9F8M5_9GLOM|nr:9085_t:CDS:2 [Paraglomus brasilianum]
MKTSLATEFRKQHPRPLDPETTSKMSQENTEDVQVPSGNLFRRRTELDAQKIQSRAPNDEEMQQPTMPSYPNAIGKAYAYRVTFILDPSEGVDRLKHMLLKAAGHNLVSRQTNTELE